MISILSRFVLLDLGVNSQNDEGDNQVTVIATTGSNGEGYAQSYLKARMTADNAWTVDCQGGCPGGSHTITAFGGGDDLLITVDNIDFASNPVVATVTISSALCTSDAQCQDVDTCNGIETCNTVSGLCEPGPVSRPSCFIYIKCFGNSSYISTFPPFLILFASLPYRPHPPELPAAEMAIVMQAKSLPAPLTASLKLHVALQPLVQQLERILSRPVRPAALLMEQAELSCTN